MANDDLSGQVILITGGARGIGAAAGSMLAARGAEVHLADVLDCDAAVASITRGHTLPLIRFEGPTPAPL